MQNRFDQPREPWGQSNRPVPPPEPQGRRRGRRPRRHRSKLAFFLMAVGFVTICALVFRFLVVPLLVLANGGM